MTTNTYRLAENDVLASSMNERWHGFWTGEIGEWIITRGMRIVMLLIVAVLAVRFVTWVADQVARQLDERFVESDALVRSEATKHRQAVASVIQWVSIVLIAIWVIVQIADVLRFSISGLIAPATVIGAALGFGAQQVVRDILSGFFIIVEKQYGFGDLVTLTIVSTAEASGTVENVTLRVTRLRSPNGEVLTIPNGQIIKAVNQSKDWARAVVDIPVSTNTDLGRVNEVLRQECEHALDNPLLRELLLDAPTVMGVESIEVDTVTLRMVARTLPGKQFEAGRLLRVLVLRALALAHIETTADATVGLVDDPAVPAAKAALSREDAATQQETHEKAADSVR
jgi:small-conductance mechanosensitive channel